MGHIRIQDLQLISSELWVLQGTEVISVELRRTNFIKNFLNRFHSDEVTQIYHWSASRWFLDKITQPLILWRFDIVSSPFHRSFWDNRAVVCSWISLSIEFLWHRTLNRIVPLTLFWNSLYSSCWRIWILFRGGWPPNETIRAFIVHRRGFSLAAGWRLWLTTDHLEKNCTWSLLSVYFKMTSWNS